MSSTQNEQKKHTKTYYNRHAIFLMYSAFLECKEIGSKTLNLYDLDDIVPYSMKSIKIHLTYLKNRGLINIKGNIDIEESVEIQLTENGNHLSFYLKDIKYQSIYNSIKRKPLTRQVGSHARTYYNRHALNILYMFCQEKNKENFNYQELVALTGFSNESISIHINYLTRDSKVKTKLMSLEGNQVKVTDFGRFVFKILKDIKYQTISGYKPKYRSKEIAYDNHL